MTDDERIAWIDQASDYELLSRWRFEPSGSPWFMGSVGNYCDNVVEALRKRRLEDGTWAQLSKEVGWRTSP